MKRKYYILLFMVAILLCFTACSPNKHLSKDGYLLSKNKIYIDNKNFGIDNNNVVNYIKQDPNHKVLGMKMGMYIYSVTRPIEDTACNFFEKYLFRKVGEKPVELSKKHTNTSIKNIKTYLNSTGCFSAKVTDTLSKVRRWFAPWSYYKKRRVENYIIEIPYRAKIDTFYLSTEDEKLYEVIFPLIKKVQIKRGDWYDESILSQIRSNVASVMQEKGYFAFNTSYINFEIDTTQGTDMTKIKMLVKNPMDNEGSTTTHKLYKISNIYIEPNYIPSTSADYLPIIDTVKEYSRLQRKMPLVPTYFIINTEKPIIRHKTLQRCVLVQKNQLYSPSISKNMYSAFLQLKNFKYVDISYEPIPPFDSDTINLLNNIRLTMLQPISLSSSFELNYSANNDNNINYGNSSNFGMEGNLSFNNRNLFHGAEVFTVKLKLAAEINSKIFLGEHDVKGWEIFNAFESGIDFGLELPRFVAPFSTKFYSMRFHPHTSIKAGYDLQRRSYYNRSIFNATFGYSWNSTEKKFLSFIPLDINYVNMNITDNDYQALINSMGRRIRYQMSDHFVMAMRYSYLYNGQVVNNKRNFNYFSFNIETAGNVLDAYSTIFNQSKDENGSYTIFNIPFSQYIRTDFTFIHYNYLTQKSSLVYKVYGGIGIPYGNAEALPYEKSFVAGGTNSLRGWQLRELGPGHSKPEGEMKYDRAGDIAFGMSIEYRFPLLDPFLEGASFIDAGNIWTLNNVSGMEGGKISKDFYKEIASDIGLGLRINAKVLILRVDFALKVWDPSKDLKERFVLDDSKFKDIAVQFGVGYPF